MLAKLVNSIIKVRRVDYKVDNMKGYAQWSLERACVQECDPFCVSMGGRTKVKPILHMTQLVIDEYLSSR